MSLTISPRDVSALLSQCKLPQCIIPLLPQLIQYLDKLMKWNRMMNLVGARTWQDALKRLVVDSFHLAFFLEENRFQTNNIWDLGSGAGLPGIPLRMIWQKGEYWLVESREKRALFLSTFLAQCPLQSTFVFHGRAESFMSTHPPADLIISRAFMPWRHLLDLVRPFLTSNGQVILLLCEENVLYSGWEETHLYKYQVGSDIRFFCSLKPRFVHTGNEKFFQKT